MSNVSNLERVFVMYSCWNFEDYRIFLSFFVFSKTSICAFTHISIACRSYRCITSLVGYEFLKYEAFIRTMCQARSNKTAS